MSSEISGISINISSTISVSTYKNEDFSPKNHFMEHLKKASMEIEALSKCKGKLEEDDAIKILLETLGASTADNQDKDNLNQKWQDNCCISGVAPSSQNNLTYDNINKK